MWRRSQVAKAADCKSAIVGSTPTGASFFLVWEHGFPVMSFAREWEDGRISSWPTKSVETHGHDRGGRWQESGISSTIFY